ncbi:MAG: RNA polymerase sigma factor [Chthoniobacteraceae bacterium]
MVPDETDDETLVVSASNGDASAFARLFDRYHEMIRAFAYRLCLGQSDAQDIAQETFIKAARSLASFRGGSSFRTWLYRIATNTGRDWLRGKMRAEKLGAALANETPDAGHAEAHAAVAEALRALPDDFRAAIVLTFYEGMSHAEAARVLGCAETTVSWRVFRAKRKLRQLLSRNHE